MGIRSFLAFHGRTCTAWLVRPSRATSPLLGIPDAWLAFQNDDDSERRRLYPVPPNWADLGDERLDLLRRMAEFVSRPSAGHAAPGTPEPPPDSDDS